MEEFVDVWWCPGLPYALLGPTACQGVEGSQVGRLGSVYAARGPLRGQSVR
jgi:hypothetical protein